MFSAPPVTLCITCRLHNAVTAPCAVRRRRLLAPIASLSLGAAAAAAAAVPPELAKTAAASALLQSSGVFILCCAGAVFLLASIPALFAIARMAHRAEAVLRVSAEQGGLWAVSAMRIPPGL